MKSGRPPSAAGRRLDSSLAQARAMAARLDKVTLGAGDPLRDAIATAVRAAIAKHETALTTTSALRDPRGNQPGS